MPKRKLTAAEKEEISREHTTREQATYPAATIRVRVEDETGENGKPIVRISHAASR